jgi:GTPase SAR1 family protein
MDSNDGILRQIKIQHIKMDGQQNTPAPKADELREATLNFFNSHGANTKMDYQEEDLLVTLTNEYELNMFVDLQMKAEKARGNKFKIVDITPIKQNAITDYCFSLAHKEHDFNGKKLKTKELFLGDRMGTYRIDFSDGTFMYFSKWMIGEGKTKCLDGIYIATKETWLKFFGILSEEKTRITKPKKGIYRIRVGAGGELEYEKVKELKETPVIHPSTSTLRDDMDFFYDNVPMFTKFNQPGTRKVMLIGPPGTGKSSISMRLASSLSKEKCVVFSTDLSAVAYHLDRCAKYKMSTFVILEDAESTLRDANSSLLNFLDGIDQPINKSGAYIVMTTNHPDRIEPRILKRPGRVDKIIHFGALKGMDALLCADIYFEDILFEEGMDQKEKDVIREKLLPVVHNAGKGMTGAEIKQLAESTVAYAVQNREDKITVEIVDIVKEKLSRDLKTVYELAEEEGLGKSSSGKPSFQTKYKKEQEQESFDFDPSRKQEGF